jgi:P pilus assembly chaperone PapD
MNNATKLQTLCLRIFLALAAVLPLRVAAYTFKPSIATLRPTGSDSSCFFKLENNEAKTSPIEITINECSKDLDGKTLQGKEAVDDFIIYPAQFVLMPGDEVGVQVRWIGEPSLKTERAYTIVAREAPMPRKADDESENDGKARVRINVLINYEGRIYVTPKGSKPDVAIESAVEQPRPAQADGISTNSEPAMLELICVNKGTAHKEMETVAFVLTPAGETSATTKKKAVILTTKDVPGLRTHLLSGDRRRFVFPRPVGLPAGPFEAGLREQ